MEIILYILLHITAIGPHESCVIDDFIDTFIYLICYQNLIAIKKYL